MTMFAVLLCVIILSAVFSPAKTATATVIAAEEDTVSVPAARFLNMLNHNYVYNDAFLSFDELTHGAMIASLNLREGDYISEAYIKGYIADMYGINAVSFEQDANADEKPGYLYIPSVGYTKFVHSNPVVNANEDGTFTVITDVAVYPHDEKPYETFAVSLFAPNSASSFGYIIVYSNIDSTAITL